MRLSTARSAAATAAVASVVLPHVVQRHRHSNSDSAFKVWVFAELAPRSDRQCHVPNMTPAHGGGPPAHPDGLAAVVALLPADETAVDEKEVAEEAVEAVKAEDEEEEAEAVEDADALAPSFARCTWQHATPRA